jgi:hypothetical protein
MTGPLVYPIGVLMMGAQLQIRPPKAEGVDPELFQNDWDHQPRHVVKPFAYTLTKFATERMLVTFPMVQRWSTRVDSIHALGPALIEAVYCKTVCLYNRPDSDEEGKLFFCPREVVDEGQSVQVLLRCLPTLFMLSGQLTELSLSDSDAELVRSHDRLACEDCADFRKRTGIEST